MKRRYIVCINLLFVFTVFIWIAFGRAGSKEDNLLITRVTPSGADVPAEREIVIQFNRPVVPIGRMERKSEEVPIEITPSLNCKWRWLNTSALSCQLDEKDAFKQATLYEIVVHPGIKAVDGSTIDEVSKYTFATEFPKVQYTYLTTWKTPNQPVVRVVFNQSVSKVSVEQHLYLSSGKPPFLERFSLKVEPDPNDRELPRYIRVPGESYVLDFGSSTLSKSDDDPHIVGGIEARRVWLAFSEKELPLDAHMGLMIEPGLESAFGKEKGIEEREILSFDTFPEFSFSGVKCTSLEDEDIIITPDNMNRAPRCDPLESVFLLFTSPVFNSEVKDNVDIIPDLTGGRDDYDPWADRSNYSGLSGWRDKGKIYSVLLPERLKVVTEYTIRTKPAKLDVLDKVKTLFVDARPCDLRDEFGRILSKPINIIFRTDHRRPNYELAHETVVLEKQIDSEMPLYVTNLNQIKVDFNSLTPNARKTKQTLTLDVPQVQDIQFAIPLGVRRMIGDGAGVVYGKISTDPEVTKGEEERTFFAQVSPYQLHVKLGHFNTLVWVTDLASGESVSNAEVIIYEDSITKLSDQYQQLDRAVTDKNGVVLLQGTKELDPKLKTFEWDCYYNDSCEKLFVRVNKGKEMVVMPLNNQFKVSTYEASNETVWNVLEEEYGHIYSWGTTAQGLYRPGETIQFKFYVRNQDNKTLITAPREGYKLELVDPMGKTVHVIEKLTLSKFGSFSGEYLIPNTAVTGWYIFRLTAGFSGHKWVPMRVLVSDFTPSPFKVENSINGDLFHPGQETQVSTAAKLHSGGAYTDAQTRVTASLRGTQFSSEHPVAKSFQFDSYREYFQEEIFQNVGMLNDQGKLSNTFVIPQKNILYGRLLVESAVQDDRGKFVAAHSTADYVAVDRLVGLKNTKWFYEEDKPAFVQYIVVDGHGNPVSGTNVAIKVERQDMKATRVKGAGNAYLANYVEEWASTGGCDGVSKIESLSCDFTPSEPGTYRFTASIKDTKGNAHSTQIFAWVTGKGEVLWQQPNDYSLQIIPEQTSYHIGDTARYLIKNPYPGARALITIERYGIIKQWVQTFDGSTPIIEFLVEVDFMPGFYLSVVVTSPRVEMPRGDWQVDLGKPTFKVGYIEVPVKDPYKEIIVDVSTDDEIYKPRDRIKAKVHAQPRKIDKTEPIEIAVVVLDEAVLDLISGGRKYFDPYEGFYHLDGLDLNNYNLLTRLIGLQKFEKKGANPGGDGGTDTSMRSLFKFVAYWNPSLVVDQNGNAEIEFEAPDNLTGWRILALAVTPTDRMGLGEGKFKVNRPTEVRPVMPNQVTEGDSFKAGFSVMNRTDRTRNITVEINVDGSVDNSGKPKSHKEGIKLPPYKRATVWVPVKATKQTVDKLEIHFHVKAGDKIDSDGLEHSIPVNKIRSLETAANYDSTVSDKVTELLEFPKGIHADVGEVSVALSPSVIGGNIEGSFLYMRDYPYTCWEQKLSKAAIAANYQNLKKYIKDSVEWRESKELPEQVLNEAANYQTPGGGFAYFIPRDGYESPYLSAYTAIVFNWLRDGGFKIPEVVEGKLHAYLETMLKKDVTPIFYSNGMASTVRAVALAALSRHGKISLSDIERYYTHVPYMSLFGLAYYLRAVHAISTPSQRTEQISEEVIQRILSHSNQTGGKFIFSEELDDSYSHILATPLRTNCAVLSSLITSKQFSEKNAVAVSDMPSKLVRTITQARGNRDHWENTQENVFCMNALVDYSRVYENAKPDMNVKVSMDSELMGSAAFADFGAGVTNMSRPIKKDDPGRKSQIMIERNGEGRLYYSTRMNYALLEDHDSRVNAGLDIQKEYSVERDGKWVLLGRPAEIKRGELVRIDIYLSLPAPRFFVVVNDPVPGGLEPVNRDLATSSVVDAKKGEFQAAGGSWWFQFSDWQMFNVSRWSFYHQELRHDAVRFYSDYLQAGNYHLSYTAQSITEGEFVIMPVYAEEMYDPDVFGKGLSGRLVVKD